MQNPKISVIVSTYNWPEALSLVLRALNEQSYTDFEVVVADAGVDVLVSLGVKARIVAFESSRRIVKCF